VGDGASAKRRLGRQPAVKICQVSGFVQIFRLILGVSLVHRRYWEGFLLRQRLALAGLPQDRDFVPRAAIAPTTLYSLLRERSGTVTIA